MMLCKAIVLVLSCVHVSAAASSEAGRKDASSSRSYHVDEILSRPAISPPLARAAAQDRAYDGSTLSLSLEDCQAIYQDHVRAISKNQRQATTVQTSSKANEVYDFADEMYGSDSEGDLDDFDGEDESTEGLSSEFAYLSSSQSTRRDTEEDIRNKLLFEKAWQARDLSCEKMKAQDLARGVTMIKVDLMEYDIASALGIYASNHVKKVTNPDYWSDYRFWIRRYTSALKHKEERIRFKEALCGINLSLDQKKRLLWHKVANAKVRTYERKRYGVGGDSQRDGTDAMMKAQRAGEVALQMIRDRLEIPDLQWNDLSIAQIEFYTRDLELNRETPKKERISRESIKRFLKRCLEKEQWEINEFSKKRLDWKLKYYQQRQQEALDPYRMKRKHTKCRTKP